MRILPSLFITTLLVLSYGTSASAQAGVQNMFTGNLSLGSRGTQVTALQKMLNQDPDTSIASIGPGSPENETTYFGMLTKSAVIRFQEKYTIDVLAPVGLVQGNGYVGLYTRMKLNALSVLAVNAQNMNSSISSASTTVSQNSNLENLDKFFAALDIVAAKQRISSSTIVVLKEQAMKRIATTTDMRATFLKLVQNNSHQAIEYNSFVNRVLATMERAFGSVFMPGRAHATVGVPFGGAILYAFLCDGGVWNITLSPLPPLYPVLLAYESGSQAFLSYNIPITHWLLGEYEPVPMAYCWVGIVPYPSEGLITPMVGSSTL